MCYLVLKDSDYLSVLFHLYDSDDEEAERHKLAQLQRDERRRSDINRCDSFLVYPPSFTWRMTHDDLQLFTTLLILGMRLSANG